MCNMKKMATWVSRMQTDRQTAERSGDEITSLLQLCWLEDEKSWSRANICAKV